MANDHNPSNSIDNYQFLVNTLESWGITMYTGVTGGGVIHFLKHINTLVDEPTGAPEFLTIGEYEAGFLPLGYFLTSGKIAAAVATTGAAIKLLTCGLSDAKLHDIPAVYIVPLSGKNTTGFSPLQDTSKYGTNTIDQLRAELPDSIFILDNQATLVEQLLLAKAILDDSKPVVLVLVNEVLNTPVTEIPVLPSNKMHSIKGEHYDSFIDVFRQAVNNKRLVVLVGEEMERYADAKKLTSELANELHAQTVWSINGANAVSRDNPYGYGYISFGGNDKALSLYESLGEDDVLLVLGACPDEYTTNLAKFKASHTFYLSNIHHAYGTINNSFQHTANGHYYQVYGPLDAIIKQLLHAGRGNPFQNKPGEPAPANLNDYPYSLPHEGYVNMADLYQRLDKWWPAGSIGFDDICLAYKDRQYVTQRPNDNINFYSLYRGSSMGGAFGAAVGAKLANPAKLVALFTGDGCFRLFSGSMGEARNMGVVVFVLNNSALSIIEQGLKKILPDFPEEKYHAYLWPIDYCGVAKACGWDAEKLNSDLSNLDDLLKKMERNSKQSLLIEVPVDPHQLLGSNPRLKNL